MQNDIMAINTLEGIADFLEKYDISTYFDNNIAELEFYTPAGEDFIISFGFDGTVESFVDEFVKYNNDFDPEEHAAMWIRAKFESPDKSSQIPGVFALVDDARWLDEFIEDIAYQLYFAENTETY